MQFVLRKNKYFEINNTDYTLNNGVYFFSDIEKIEFYNERVDWFPTIIYFFLGRGFGVDTVDDRLLIHFRSGKKKEVKFIHCNEVEIQRLLKEFGAKLNLEYAN